MSYLPPDQTNQQAPTGQTTNAPGQLPPQGAGGSVGAGTGAGGGKAGATPNTGTSTQFGSSSSKLGDYLTANAPQITQQASNIAGGLNNQYGQVNQDITGGAQQFQQAVNGGYTAQNTGLVDQAFQNPTGFVTNPNNVSGFQSQYNDQYTGPQNYESTSPYSTIQNEVSNAVSTAGTLGSQGGLSNYLQGFEKNPTQAQSTLDALLVNGNPDAQKQVSQAAGQFQNLTPAFQNSVTASNALVPQAQANAAAANQYAHDQFGNAVTGFNTNVGNEVTNASNQVNQYNTQATAEQQQAQNAKSAIQNYLASAPAVQADISGLNPYTSLQPLTGNAPTAANVATTQDYQTQAALQQLVGAGVPIQTAIQQATANQAGTALPQNFTALQAALAGYPQAQDAALGNVGTGLNTASTPALGAAQNIQDLKNYENTQKTDKATLAKDQAVLAKMQPPTFHGVTPEYAKQYAAEQQKVKADQAALNGLKAPGGDDSLTKKQADASQIGQGQWINGADTGYNSLLSYLGSGLTPTTVNTLPTQADVTPDTSDAGFGLGSNVLAALANPLTTVPAQIKSAKKAI